jgi:hypothetical protein
MAQADRRRNAKPTNTGIAANNKYFCIRFIRLPLSKICFVRHYTVTA